MSVLGMEAAGGRLRQWGIDGNTATDAEPWMMRCCTFRQDRSRKRYLRRPPEGRLSVAVERGSKAGSGNCADDSGSAGGKLVVKSDGDV